MSKDREPVVLGQSFYPFRKGNNNRVQIALAPKAQPLSIDFGIQVVNHPSLSNAGYFVCEGAQLIDPLVLTTNGVYINSAHRLDLSVYLPGAPTITGKVRTGDFEEGKLDLWYFDPSLRLPRIKTQHFLPPYLPALATPEFLGPDRYNVGEAFGGRLLIRNTPDYLRDIRVEFSLTDQHALPIILGAKRELWERYWRRFDWGRLLGNLPEKGLSEVYELLLYSNSLGQQETDMILELIGESEFPRSADELIEQAGVVQASACRWVEKRITDLADIRRQQWKREFFSI